MELSRPTVYAIRMIRELAKRDLCIATRDLAATAGVPLEYIARVMAPLTEAGIVETLKGPGGGYALTRSAAKITVADVVQAMPPGLLPVDTDTPPETARIIEGVRRLVLAALSTKSVIDL